MFLLDFNILQGVKLLRKIIKGHSWVKRAKLFTTVILLMVMTCVLYAGIYSASSIKDVQFAGSISIPANVIGVDVYGYMGESTSSSALRFDTTTGATSWELSSEDIVFDLEDVNTVEDIEDIPEVVLTLRIVNNSGLRLKSYLTKSVDNVETEFLTDSLVFQNEDVVDVLVDTGTQGVDYVILEPEESATGTEQIIRLRFSIVKIVEDNATINFSYNLTFKQYNQ